MPPPILRAALIAVACLLSGAIHSSAGAAPVASSGAGATGRYPNKSDASLAVGTTRQILLVNDTFRISRRVTPDQNQLISTGSQNNFVGALAPMQSHASDVIWDDKTARFYFVVSAWDGKDAELHYGWSKTGSPDSPGDFCRYSLTFAGSKLLFPAIGDTRARLIIGYNRTASANRAFLRSDLIVAVKPEAGTACPVAPTVIIHLDLRTPAGERLYGPTPANQIDGNPVGYVVARTARLPARELAVVRVSESGRVDAILETYALNVGSFDAPPPVAQRGAPHLNTGDARPTQAVLARVPRHRQNFSLFTQHTVANGALPVVDWYELNPEGTPTIRRRGRIDGAGFGAFNAAIAPNRSVVANVASGGDDLTLVYNTSSAAFYPRVRASTSIKGAAWTAADLWNATAPFVDRFSSCGGGRPAICPWGGASAAPDPLQHKVWAALPLPAASSAQATTTNLWQARVYQITP